MRRVDERHSSLRLFRLAALATISVAAAGCSTDTARFNSNPYQAQGRGPSNEATGSTPHRSNSIQSAPLPPPTASAPPTRPAMVGTGGVAPAATYQQPMRSAQPRNEATAALPPPPSRTAASQSNWNWEGGTAVTVQHGDTVDGLVKRYGVPASAIAEANNIPNGAALRPGQRLVIPRYEATGSTNARPASAPPRAEAPAISVPRGTGGQHVHVVGPGETLMALARKYNKSLTEIARANNLAPHTMVKVGDRIVIPGVAPLSAASPAAKPVPPVVAQQPKAAQPEKIAAAPKTVPAPAQPVPAPTAAVVSPVTQEPEPQRSKTDVTSAMPKFRWPVNGRVISAFGSTPAGQRNDGINVSVPEGTPIKAAEDGVVAYAGNELKSYGNLVLIRHSNGYVTAYAHASEINVKRDEVIKRGQIIAKAGQTGTVSAPQLHFEVRKGSTPVDPQPFLDKGG